MCILSLFIHLNHYNKTLKENSYIPYQRPRHAQDKPYIPNSISTKYMNDIISAIPNNWKHIIMCETMIHDLICNLTNYIFRELWKSLVCAIKMRKRFRNFCRRLAWHLFNVLCIAKDTKLQFLESNDLAAVYNYYKTLSITANHITFYISRVPRALRVKIHFEDYIWIANEVPSFLRV
jgi:hypothetical protein